MFKKPLLVFIRDLAALGAKRMSAREDVPELLYLTVVQSARLTPLAIVFEYVSGLATDNALFLFWWGVVMLANMFAGVVTHLKLKTFCWKEFILNNSIMAVLTMSVYVSVFGALEVANNFATDAVLKSLQISVILYPLSKIFKNAHILTDGVFPPGWIVSKIYNFERDGNLKNFTDLRNEDHKKD